MTEIIQEEQVVKEVVAEQPKILEKPLKEKKNLRFLILFPIFIILMGAAYYLGTLSSSKDIAEIVPNQEVLVEKEEIVPNREVLVEKEEIVELKEELIVYNNNDINLKFSYPASWRIKDSEGQKVNSQIFNTKVELSKGNALIKMYFNMDGIGGLGQKYSGEEYNLDGYHLYKYKKTDEYSKSKIIGISNSLEETLGVFMVNDNTHSIVLSYPDNIEPNEEEELLKEFDLILSTLDISEVRSGLV